MGCGTKGYYPVSGRVVDAADQPIEGLEGCEVVFSSLDEKTSSIGEIKKDGKFQMFTERAGDGVSPGEYQVMITRKYLDPEHMTPQAIASKYEKFTTSGMTATVEPKSNHFDFKVERVKAGAR